MPLSIRNSKFRHVYGSPAKERNCYRNLKLARNTNNSSPSDVNQKFLAVGVENFGGGSFIVLNLEDTGRISTDHPSVIGHRADVTDIKWNPFNPHQVVSSSDDSFVRLWNIPQDGLSRNMSKPFAELRSHQSRVSHVRWNPIAENILASVGHDRKIMVWDVNCLKPVFAFGVFPNITYSISWCLSGTTLASTNKDRKIRTFDVRSEKVSAEVMGHSGMRPSKVCFMRDEQRLFTCGFSKIGSRQFSMWDLRNMTSPLATETMDHENGVLIPHYDSDLDIVYLIGKGDGNFRYYELLNTEPYFYFLNEYSSSQPQSGFCAMPKVGLDFNRNEIARIYKLYACGGIVEPISMIVPRKSEHFQSDIYPDTLDTIPAMTPQEWIRGENKDPSKVPIRELFDSFRRNSFFSADKAKSSFNGSSVENLADHQDRHRNGSACRPNAENNKFQTIPDDRCLDDNDMMVCHHRSTQSSPARQTNRRHTDDHHLCSVPVVRQYRQPAQKPVSVLEYVRQLDESINRSAQSNSVFQSQNKLRTTEIPKNNVKEITKQISTRMSTSSSSPLHTSKHDHKQRVNRSVTWNHRSLQQNDQVDHSSEKKIRKLTDRESQKKSPSTYGGCQSTADKDEAMMTTMSAALQSWSSSTEHKQADDRDPIKQLDDPTKQTDDRDPTKQTDDPSKQTYDPSKQTYDPSKQTDDPSKQTDDPSKQTDDPVTVESDSRRPKTCSDDVQPQIAGPPAYLQKLESAMRRANATMTASSTASTTMTPTMTSSSCQDIVHPKQHCPPYRTEKLTEHWRSMKELYKRMMSHEERIRQLEVKLYEQQQSNSQQQQQQPQ